MPDFQFKAIDAQGRITTGSSSAQSTESLARILEGQGLFLMESREAAAAEALPSSGGWAHDLLSRLPRRRKKISYKELTLFTAQLSVMIRTALPILEAIQLLAAQTPNPAFKAILLEVGRQVSEGEPLSAAFGRYPRQFDDIYISLLAAGEVSGQLDVMLERLANHMDFQMKLKDKIRSALVYPVIVIATAFTVVGFLVVFVIPTFMQVFAELNVNLPLPTVILIVVSTAVRKWWYMGFVAAGGALFAFKQWVRAPDNARAFMRFQLRLPIIGDLVRNVVITRILRTLGSLLGSGISMMKSLELSKGAAANILYRDLLEKVGQEVKEGMPLSRSLGKSPLIPPVVVGMVATGEKTGTLPEVIDRVAGFYEAETDTSIKNLFSALEPAFIVGLGIMVGCIAVSVLLPMFDLAQGIQ